MLYCELRGAATKSPKRAAGKLLSQEPTNGEAVFFEVDKSSGDWCACLFATREESGWSSLSLTGRSIPWCRILCSVLIPQRSGHCERRIATRELRRKELNLQGFRHPFPAWNGQPFEGYPHIIQLR